MKCRQKLSSDCILYTLVADDAKHGCALLQALNRDVAEVNELLPEQDRLELLDMVQSSSTRQNKRLE